MNPSDKKSSQPKGAGKVSARQPIRQAVAIAPPRSIKNTVQAKQAIPPQIKRQPIAPPVYRPQATPKAVQPKMANVAVSRKPPPAPPAYRPQQSPRVLQTKSAPAQRPQAGQAPRQPVAPPVYRPGVKKIVQPKAISQLRTSPAAPPVYRPGQERSVQPKMASAANAHRLPKAPTVYRPQPNQVHAQSGQPVQMKSKMVTPQANMPQPARRQMNAPGGDGIYKPSTNISVIQRMEVPKKDEEESLLYKIGSFLAPKISTIFSIPNIFEMTQFTSCVCLVFNRAEMSMEDVKNISGDYRKTFKQVKEKWKMGGKQRPFISMCPCDAEGKSTIEFSKFCATAIDSSMLGSNPLIVVIGHCSAGSSWISGDKETGLNFTVTQVFDVIRPLMTKNCTIFLTPCSTAVSKKESLSFQDHLINEIEETAPGAYIIGTNSTSIPIGGEVISTGYTVKHTKGGELSLEEFKFLQAQQGASTSSSTVGGMPQFQIGQSSSGERKRRSKRGRKVRVITYIPTVEEAKRGIKEEYHYEYKK